MVRQMGLCYVFKKHEMPFRCLSNFFLQHIPVQQLTVRFLSYASGTILSLAASLKKTKEEIRRGSK